MLAVPFVLAPLHTFHRIHGIALLTPLPRVIIVPAGGAPSSRGGKPERAAGHLVFSLPLPSPSVIIKPAGGAGLHRNEGIGGCWGAAGLLVRGNPARRVPLRIFSFFPCFPHQCCYTHPRPAGDVQPATVPPWKLTRRRPSTLIEPAGGVGFPSRLSHGDGREQPSPPAFSSPMPPPPHQTPLPRSGATLETIPGCQRRRTDVVFFP
jgi:hypothetical protein